MAAPTASGSFTEIFNTLSVPTNYAGNTFASNAAIVTVAQNTDPLRLFWTVRTAQVTLSPSVSTVLGQTYSRRIAFLAPFNGVGKSIIVPYVGINSNAATPALLATYTGAATGAFLTLFSGTVGTFTDYKTFPLGRNAQTKYPYTSWDCSFIQIDSVGLAAYSGGTFDPTNIWGFEATFGFDSNGANRRLALFEMFLVNSSPKILGGDITTPVTSQYLNSLWGLASVLPLQSSRLMLIHSVESTFYLFHPAIVGDISSPAYWLESDFEISSWRKPLASENIRCFAVDGFNGLDVYFALGSSWTRAKIGSLGTRFSKFNVLGVGSIPVVDSNFDYLKPVSLYSGWNQTGGSWSNCGEIVANGATISNVSIFGSTDTSALSINTSAVVSNVAIRNCSAGIKLLVNGTYSSLSATITSSAVADVIIPAGVVGAINITGIVFPTSGSTSPVNIRYEGVGTVTVTANRSGLTTSTPSGGTIVLVTPLPTIAITTTPVAARVGVYRISDNFEIMNVNSNGTTGLASTTYSGSLPASVLVSGRLAGYQDYSAVQTITTAGLTLAIALPVDRNYNPSY